MALTVKRRKFVAVYAGNGVEAARAAGYTGNPNTLAQTAHELLSDPEVKAAIHAREGSEARSLIATRAERQAFWTAVMKGRLEEADPEDAKEPPERQSMLTRYITDMQVRLKASELLGRSEADFTDKLAGADGGPLEVVIRLESAEDED